MAKRKSNIKWRPQDTKKLSTAVRKFNAAITRLEKLNPELEGSGVIPERYVVSEQKSAITTRSDFNRFIAKIERFFRKGAKDIIKGENGYYTTRWASKEEKLLERRINKRRAEAVKTFGISRDEVRALKLGQVNISEEKARIFKKYGVQGEAKWQSFVYSIERESNDNYYTSLSSRVRSQYITALENAFGSDADRLIKFLNDNKILGSDILLAFQKNDILSFEFIYSKEDAANKVYQLEDYWEKIWGEMKAEREK